MEESPGGLGERIALVGPTAVGKTAVGIILARRLDAEIVSADSMQVYREMDIGTAKPTLEEQSQTVFHAINVASPDDEWTLANYQQLGENVCPQIAARGRVPLIVGGTGLYVRALTTRLDIPIAPPNEELRIYWREFAKTNGNAALLSELAKVDPESAARLHVNDIGRQIRALEVYAATGQTLTTLHTENRARQMGPSPLLYGLHFVDRSLLYARIDARVDQMLAEGLLDEVKSLLGQGYGAHLKPMQSLGYRHMTAYLAGDMDWETAVATMKQDTRRFSKRQLIWFRGDKRVHWVTADSKTTEQLADEIWESIHNEQNAA